MATFALLLICLPFVAGSGRTLELVNLFYRAGALVFGGGHVVLPLLHEQLVPQWMSDGRFLSGYGAAQAMPGPLFSIASYFGAVAVPGAPVAGAVLAIVSIFLPGLLLLTGALAFRRGIMATGWLRRAMAGVNAAVVGILAAAVYYPLWTTGIATWADAAIVGTGILLLLLLRFRMPPLLAVVLCVATAVAVMA